MLPGWHPIIVHFPLALTIVAAFCLTLARLLKRHAAAMATCGTWNLCIGAFAILPALASGLAAAIDVHVGAAAHQALSAHVKSAIVTTFLVIGVALWRGFGVAAASRPSRPFILLLWIACASLVMTGYRGGQNVYRYGIGVQPGAVTAPSAGL